MKCFLLILLVACGGKAKPPACDDCGQPPMNPQPFLDVKEQTSRLCDAAREKHDSGCAPFDKLTDDVLTSCSVAQNLWMTGFDECVAKPTCDEAQECVKNVQTVGAPYRGPTSDCTGAVNQPDYALPAGLTPNEIAQSYGYSDVTFADSPSSVDQPIEVCGFGAMMQYFVREQCKDGSHPFKSAAALGAARVGTGQQGGRCNRWVDQYDVPCPETTYHVFIDAYRCRAALTAPR